MFKHRLTIGLGKAPGWYLGVLNIHLMKNKERHLAFDVKIQSI